MISVDNSARLSTRVLARDVGLAKQLKTFASQNRDGAFIIIDVKSEGSLTAGTHQKRISEMDVHFGHEKRRQELGQLRRDLSHFHYDDLAHSISDIVLPKQFFHASGITYHHPRDGGVGGLRNAHRHDVDLVRVE